MTQLDVNQLKQPEFWGASPESFDVIETHLSWVFLANGDAWKLKKPVSLYFVDYSTLENRKFFCEEEVRLNRRSAPGYYLGVKPLTAVGDRYQLDGEGPVIDT